MVLFCYTMSYTILFIIKNIVKLFSNPDTGFGTIVSNGKYKKMKLEHTF